MDPKMTVTEAAAFLNISPQAVHKRIKASNLTINRNQGLTPLTVSINNFTGLTNNDVYNMSIDEQKKSFVAMIKNTRFSGDQLDQYAANSYYYLTNKPFGKTGKYLLKVGDEPEEYDYFKTSSK